MSDDPPDDPEADPFALVPGDDPDDDDADDDPPMSPAEVAALLDLARDPDALRAAFAAVEPADLALTDAEARALLGAEAEGKPLGG